jgi:hypothetical protein
MTSVRTQPEWAPDGGSQEAPRPGYRRRVAADRTLRIELLGGFRVSLGERAVPAMEWRRSKAASLVKLLALAQGHRLHREQAMDVRWPTSHPPRRPQICARPFIMRGARSLPTRAPA